MKLYEATPLQLHHMKSTANFAASQQTLAIPEAKYLHSSPPASEVYLHTHSAHCTNQPDLTLRTHLNKVLLGLPRCVYQYISQRALGQVAQPTVHAPMNVVFISTTSICSCFGELLLAVFDSFCSVLAFLSQILNACICKKPTGHQPESDQELPHSDVQQKQPATTKSSKTEGT